MSFSLVAHTVAQSSAGSDVTTTSINTTGANRLVVGATWYVSSGSGGAVGDNKSNTFVGIGTPLSNGANYLQLFECKNPTVGTGHTFNAAGFGSGSFPSIAVTAWSGNDTASSADQQNGSAGGSGLSTLQPGSITPSVNDELVISVLGGEATGTVSVDSGMTISDQVALIGGTSFAIALAYKIQTTAAAINPTWSGIGGTYANAQIASFKSAAGGAATATTLSGPSSGAVNAASTNYTVGANGTITGTVTVTPATDVSSGGSFTPSSVNISSGTPTATFTFTPSKSGLHHISTTNNGGLSNPTALNYTVTPAVTFQVSDAQGILLTGLSGLHWMWLDVTDANSATTVANKGTTMSTDGSANSTLNLPNSTLTNGQSGMVVYHNAAGTLVGWGVFPVT